MSEDTPATKRDLEGLVTRQWFEEHGATKRDLEGLATKRDLEGLVTRQWFDEQAAATKRDLEGLATKRDLDGLVTRQWFDEQAAATKRDLDELRRDLTTKASKADLDELRRDLGVEIEQSGMRVANVMIEHIQKLISVVDEKYQDLPRDHGTLRSDFDAHAGDARLHVSPPVTPPKRARRSPR